MNTRKLKQGWYVEAECKALVPEGLGLSHLDREMVGDKYKPLTGFVWGVLPGERFVARVTRVHSSYFHAVLAEKTELPADWLFRTGEPCAHDRFALFNLSEQRVEPRCENFTLCGGCKLLHLSYPQTLEYKKNWLETQLQRSQVSYPEITVEPSPLEFHYRNHVQVHINLQKQRGFYAPYSYRVQPFPKYGCLLFDQKIFDQTFPDQYELERCVRSRLDKLSGQVLTVPLHSRADKTATFTYHVEFPRGSSTAITVPNTAFFQVNSVALPGWLETLQYLVGSSAAGGKVSVLELFSGFGFITRMLSYNIPLRVIAADILSKKNLLKSVIANDKLGEPPLKDFADHYLEADLYDASRLSQVFDQKLEKNTFDILLINPPRGGLPEASMHYFMDHIRWLGQPRVVYSSCNAATMARDLVIFEKYGLRLTYLKLFDFFPYTSHYEAVGLLEKEK